VEQAMMKHIREAIRLSGIPATEIEVSNTKKGHIHLRRNGRLIVCSSTPSDPTIAARNIANDLRKRT
jgi:hypothetical protein